MSEVTHILESIERGDPHAAEQLLPLVNEERGQRTAARRGHWKTYTGVL
jgi:hypothetical protein